jgi:hypothetical protein
MLRGGQTTVVAKQFVTALQNYTKVEQEYRKKQRERVQRQLKIGWFYSYFCSDWAEGFEQWNLTQLSKKSKLCWTERVETGFSPTPWVEFRALLLGGLTFSSFLVVEH